MSRFRNMTTLLVLLLVTLGVLAGIRKIESNLDRTISTEKLRFSGAVSDAPPAVAFTTVALGSFRGLLADILWLRSESLKSKKNYFEMVQLARWITDLQPNYSAGTAYLAWNLAYNISVTSSSWEDRWYWVNEGIKLIRDKAMLYNPDDPLLYRELAWIYLHKLGNMMDDANMYYKNQMAVQMGNILGSTTPDWEALAATPVGKVEFLKLYPEDNPVWEGVKKAGFKDYDALFTAFKAKEVAGLPDMLRLYMTAEDFRAWDAYFRAELLRERLKLDPRKMVEIDRRYGKMDWRVPESQAIYWAVLGVDKSTADGGKPDINCTRIISSGLQAAFRSGRILMMDAEQGRHIQVVPNLNLADSAYEAFESAESEFTGGAKHSFFSAKINYLKDAIPLIYINGNISKAQEFFDKLVAVDGKQKRNSLDEFVMLQYAEDVRDADWEKASAIVSGLVQRAINCMIWGDFDAANANERIARYIHASYMNANKDVKRNSLQPYDEIKKGVLDNNLRNLPQKQREILERLIAEEKARKAEEAQWKSEKRETSGM